MKGKEQLMRRHSSVTLAALALGLTALISGAACKKAEAPVVTAAPTVAIPTAVPAPAIQVTDVSLGKSIGADKKVQTPTDTFAPKDTIFASVSTDGTAPAAVIHAKWTYQEAQIVKDDSRTVALAGPAVTEFSIQKPDGWPKGNYKVEIMVEGGPPATTKTFRVE
jgi:hypothetical protein